MLEYQETLEFAFTGIGIISDFELERYVSQAVVTI